MDWLTSMAMGGQGEPSKRLDESGVMVEDDDDEDFYGDGNGISEHTGGPGAAAYEDHMNTTTDNSSGTARPSNFNALYGQVQSRQTSHAEAMRSQPAETPSEEEKRAEKQEKAERIKKKTDELRAKLMAKRQNTSSNGQSRSNTPIKPSTVAQMVQMRSAQHVQEDQNEPSSDIYGLETLLAEGKAAAEAKQKMQAAAVAAITSPSPTKQDLHTNSQHDSLNKQIATPPPKLNGVKQQEIPRPTTDTTDRPAALTDPYYADLALWLEVTGYHDEEYRKSKLHTFKERKALEAEAARIQERLDKLREAELSAIQTLRAAPVHRISSMQAPPTLPEAMPTVNTKQAIAQNTSPIVNGAKRAHSPESLQPLKSRREDTNTGFRIRGANDSPYERAPPSRGRLHSRSPPSAGGLERRISYPDSRRYTNEGINGRPVIKNEGSRDPSLERRQNYYRHQQDVALDERNRYEQMPAREISRDGQPGRGRMGYSSVNVSGDTVGEYRDRPRFIRGSAELELGRRGVRYFMIKSWNHENVATAMRDGIWATQEKNEQLLTEAFHTSRHVVLLFSVNKSTAFQGYAIMASPPDPSLPMPPFCAKLNWATSPAFCLRWLATTSVHFRFVGHLKNEFNPGEDGKPMAVLVGKDGQEISPETGRGVVEILDDAKVVEGERGTRGGRG